MDEETTENQDTGAPPWMATFADLSTLLLTFFILLLSFATMDLVKFKDAMGSVQETLGVFPAGTGVFEHTSEPPIIDTPPIATSVSTAEVKNRQKAQRKKEIIEELKGMVKEKGLENDVGIENSERGVIMRVKGKIFFNIGTAELKKESFPVLEKIAELMKKFPHHIAIEGHTDNLPIKSPLYPTNWHLSTARAFSALQFLREGGGVDVKRINIAGFSDTRPIAGNDTREGRAKNRRVQFVFYEE